MAKRKKALLVWELGGGRGHICTLSAIAKCLEKYEIEPILALKPSKLKLDLPWKTVTSPQVSIKPLHDGSFDSYFCTDVLHIHGFGDEHTLKYHIKAWENLINLVKPDLIIADFAPASVLAAKNKVPVFVVGHSFYVPPYFDQPAVRNNPPQQAIDRKKIIASVVQKVTKREESLGELLNGDCSFVLTIPQLDLYRNYRNNSTRYLGDYNAPIQQCLGNPSGPVWTYLRDDWLHKKELNFRLNLKPSYGNFNSVLKGKSAVIHHGGIGTSLSCLLAGIPQIIYPLDLEKQLNGSMLSQLGVARVIVDMSQLNESLDLLSENFLVAQKVAQELKHWNHSFLDKIAQKFLLEIN